MSNTTSSSLSQETKEIFKEIELDSQRQGKYLKLQPGEVRTLKFSLEPNKIERVASDFNGKITQRVQYSVIDPKINDSEVKILSMSLSNANRINKFLEEGHDTLRIQRIGSGLQTTYNISPAS